MQVRMSRFVEGEDRSKQTMLPACLDDYIVEDNRPRHRQLSYTISSSRLRLRWFSSTNFVAASSNVQRA
jgi:hypothetical protein